MHHLILLQSFAQTASAVTGPSEGFSLMDVIAERELFTKSLRARTLVLYPEA